MPKPSTVYQLKVTLLDIRPPIWRRLQVPASITMEKLHYALQDALGWTNSHLHQFVLGADRFGMRLIDEDRELLDERKYRLKDLVGEKSRFAYEYDFGDGWEHLVVVEKVLPAAPDTRYPLCLAGKRACPPEDCGGPFAYADFLVALSDPADPRHDELLEWIGGPFDPERFDLTDVNSALRTSRTRRLTESLA